DEREAVLTLLDDWPLGDGWRGRDFFRRYLERDPTSRDDNLWVAEHGGRLGWTLWPRPRPLWLRGGAATPDPARRVDAFTAARDLDAVIALHARYSAALGGTVVRDRAFWEGQLALA